MKKAILCVMLFLGCIYADNRWTSYLFSNDYTTVRQGIRLGGDLNARWRGMTPLYNACRSGWGETVELMIERGADLNAQSYGETPLLKVAGKRVNDVVLARILIENGAKINVQDSQGNTPLYHAVMNKNPKMIKLLLENGADMYLQNKKGDSPARFILSKKSMPSVSFDSPDLMLSSQPFLLGKNSATIGVVNKSSQFMKITQVAVYFNGDLAGEAQVSITIPPKAKNENIAMVKLLASMYKSFKIDEEGKTGVSYGMAIEYSLDGSQKSFEESKKVELVLW